MNYKEKILELRRSGKNYDEITNILGCAKSTVSFHSLNNGLGGVKNNTNLTDEIKIEMDEFYQINTLKETAKYFKVSIETVKRYCKKNGRGGLSIEQKKQNSVIAVQKRRDKVKELRIEYKGGSCEICGYNKYNGALEFHHLDPNEKDFSISSKGYTRSWEKVKTELDKCVMLCANCHREVHAGLIKL